MIITIDGPAGSGKSAAAYALAQRLSLPFLDTGAMYRAVALDAQEHELLDDPGAMTDRAAVVRLEFDWSTHPPAIWLEGVDVSEDIRRPSVTAVTYKAADNPGVRGELVKRQRAIARKMGSLVTEGRDQGSIVFPDAEFKFYLDADPTERARRRIVQLQAKGVTADLADVRDAIDLRDQRDRERAVGPLMRPVDSILIDTTTMALDEVVEALAKVIQRSAATTQ